MSGWIGAWGAGGSGTFTDLTVTNSASISVNTSTDALKITQIGSGNALVVEDSATIDFSPVVIDGDGYIVAGNTSRLNAPILGIGAAKLEVIGTTNPTSQAAIWRFSADGDQPRMVFYKSRSATIGTNVAVNTGEPLGSILFCGADGTDYAIGASIAAFVDGGVSTNDMPTKLIFSTTPDGASSPTPKMTIDNQGAVAIDSNSSSNALRITQTGSGNALLVEDSAYPDSSPFVIDTNGRVVIGNTTPRSIGGDLFPFTIDGLDYTGSSPLFVCNSNNPNPVILQLAKSRGTTVGSVTSVANNDTLGRIDFRGADGTGLIQAAVISAAVDGTPGTNDMPGRLVFSTTPDGASIPTERMRINNAGSVGIGTTSPGGFSGTLTVAGTGEPASGLMAGIMSSVTASATATRLDAFYSVPNTAAATALATLNHYFVSQGTIGAGATITNQIGYRVSNTPIGATNNYGFFSEIPSGAGRYNFYATGTADNYFAGNTYTASGTTTMTSGFFHIPAAAGAPTGVPTAVAGRVPMYYDTTNNNFYIYNGAWKKVLLA